MMSFSFLYPTTREQKEYVASCNYYFNILTPLADPKSRTHWVEYFKALDHTTIPAHILYAATLHGHYVLLNGPRKHLLTDLVFRTIESPHPRSVWATVFETQDPSILSLTHEPKSGWRPQNYDSLREKVLSRPAWKDNINKPFRRELSPRLEKQQEEVFMALAKLEERIKEVNETLARSETLERKCDLIGTTHGVALLPVKVERLEDAAECGICQYTLRVDLAADIGLLASKSKKRDVKKVSTARERVTAMKRRVTQGLNAQEKPWAKKEFERLREVVARDVQGMTSRNDLIDRLTSDVLEFKKGADAARWSIKKLEETRCVDPVELKCGHKLGLRCISLWLDKAKTCPYCRCELAAPTPQAETYQIPLNISASIGTDQDMEAEIEAVEQVEEDEEVIRALNILHTFTCEGVSLDPHGDDEYESDVEPCDL